MVQCRIVQKTRTFHRPARNLQLHESDGPPDDSGSVRVHAARFTFFACFAAKIKSIRPRRLPNLGPSKEVPGPSGAS